MIPILYDKTYSSVIDNDVIGFLSDCVSCNVTEEKNGAFTAEIVYPIDGVFFDDMLPARIIRLLSNHDNGFKRYQLFRIWKISRPMDMHGSLICTFYLRHISYDLDGVIVFPGGVYFGTANTVMNNAILNSTDPNTPFDVFSDIPSSRNVSMIVSSPVSFRSFLAGMDGSLLDTVGVGELEFDNFSVALLASRTNQPAVHVRYGKNILELNDDIDAGNAYTHILPYAYKTVDDETFIVYKNGAKTIPLTGAYNIGRDRVLPLDFTSYFSNADDITMFTVEDAANNYIETHNVKNVIRTLNCKFADLRGYENYKNVPIEDVALCGYADVYFEKLGIHEQMQIVKTTFDTLGEVYTDITLGEKMSIFSDKFAKISKRAKLLKTQVDILKQK